MMEGLRIVNDPPRRLRQKLLANPFGQGIGVIPAKTVGFTNSQIDQFILEPPATEPAPGVRDPVLECEDQILHTAGAILIPLDSSPGGVTSSSWRWPLL